MAAATIVKRIMSKQTNDFQQLITMIMELLIDGEVVESKEFPDPDTDEPREVDVYALIRGKRSDGQRIRIAVECVDWARKADAPWVEKMYGKHCRLQVADVVLLVSKKGFFRPAEAKAKAFGYLTIHPAIKPRTLSKKLGLAGGMAISAKMTTVQFAPTVHIEVTLPAEGWEPIDGDYFLRSDGTELVGVGEFRNHNFFQQVGAAIASPDEVLHPESANSENEYTVEAPVHDGQPLFATARSQDGQIAIVPVTKVSFTAKLDMSERIDLSQNETGTFNGIEFGTGTTSFGGQPARLLVAQDSVGNWQATGKWQYEVKPPTEQPANTTS